MTSTISPITCYDLDVILKRKKNAPKTCLTRFALANQYLVESKSVLN